MGARPAVAGAGFSWVPCDSLFAIPLIVEDRAPGSNPAVKPRQKNLRFVGIERGVFQLYELIATALRARTGGEMMEEFAGPRIVGQRFLDPGRLGGSTCLQPPNLVDNNAIGETHVNFRPIYDIEMDRSNHL
jgi:hypothetical protein